MTAGRWMIAIALAALVPIGVVAVSEAREAARRGQCVDNLKLLGLGLHNYHSVYETFPAGTAGDPTLPPGRRLAWPVVIFTYLMGGFELIVDGSRPWDSPANLRPLFRHNSKGDDDPSFTRSARDCGGFLQCPSHPMPAPPDAPAPAGYVGVAGLGTDAASLPPGHPRTGVFGYDRVTRIVDITDGASATLMLAETTTPAGPWTAGGPATVRGVDPGRRPYIGRDRPFGGSHPDGAMVAFADGSVRFVRESIDPKVFEAVSTIAGGEPLPAGWDR